MSVEMESFSVGSRNRRRGCEIVTAGTSELANSSSSALDFVGHQTIVTIP